MTNNTTEPSRSIRWLAWGLAAAIAVAAVAVGLWTLRAQPPDSLAQAISRLTMAIAFSVFGVIGALIVARYPRHTVGWLLLLEGALVFAWPLDAYYGGLAAPPAQPSALFLLGLVVAGILWLWLIFPLLFIILYFPTGSLPSPRWRWLRTLGVGLIVFFLVAGLLLAEEWPAPGEPPPWTVPNPIGGVASFEFPYPLWVALLLTFVAGSVASLFVRFRRADRVERGQIKWLLYACGIFLVVYTLGFTNVALNDIGNAVLNLSILSLPVAIGIAILRYRLYDIDVVIRKTLVYSALTVLLALVYFGSVILLQRLFGALTGIEQSTLAVVISTLVIAALFTPLRRRIQDWIDRRFFRKKYDAQQVLTQFAQTCRDETDLDALLAELVRVVDETLQPESVSVWLRE
jgi:hypothetical protein